MAVMYVDGKQQIYFESESESEIWLILPECFTLSKFIVQATYGVAN